MLTNVDLFLIWTIVTAFAFWCVDDGRARLVTLVVSSCIFIWSLAPWSLVLGGYVALSGYAIVYFSINKQIKVPFLVIAAALIGPLIATKVAWAAFGRVDTNLQLLITLGLGFFTLRVYAAVMDGLRKRQVAGLGQFLLVTTFFPIYTAGPIERIETFAPSKLEKRFNPWDTVFGVCWILIGLFKVSYVADEILLSSTAYLFPGVPKDFSQVTAGGWYIYTLLRFLHTYVAFSGYMDMAIGTAMIFSIKVMENFNFPLMSTNVREFWQRWHISLGKFVQNYIFFPVFLRLRNRWRVQIASIVAFGLIGLWHELSVQYTVWGILHGVAFALAWTLNEQRPPWLQAIVAIPHSKYLFMMLTVTYVAFVQTLANMPDTDAMAHYLFALVW